MKERTKQVKFCIHCGAEFPSGAKFCPDCGKPRHVAAERPATENPVVAGTAAVLSDPKKRRVAFVVIAVAVILVLGIALLAGGREAASQGDDLPNVPPVSDGAEGSGEIIPQDEEQEEGQTDSETAVDTDQTMDIVPEKPVDPADHIFPDLEVFFGLPLEKDNEHNARGWRWQFEDVKPYDQLEAVKSELLTLLQEPRWQLELVDEEHAVYETGDMNAADHYYFRYTGTAALTQIEDDLGLRLDHVNVVFYHHAVYDKYTIDIFRSPELEAVDPGSRISADVGTPEKESGSDADNDFFEKCSACHGSGRCTHCGGDDEVKKFQAGLGWVEQNCTFCSGGRCRYCGGSGKA